MAKIIVTYIDRKTNTEKAITVNPDRFRYRGYYLGQQNIYDGVDRAMRRAAGSAVPIDGVLSRAYWVDDDGRSRIGHAWRSDRKSFGRARLNSVIVSERLRPLWMASQLGTREAILELIETAEEDLRDDDFEPVKRTKWAREGYLGAFLLIQKTQQDGIDLAC